MKKLFLGLMLAASSLLGTASAATTSVSFYESYGSYSLVSVGECTFRNGSYYSDTVYERTVSVIRVTSYAPEAGETFAPYRVKTLEYQYTQTRYSSSNCYGA